MEFSFEPLLKSKTRRQTRICSTLQKGLVNSQETTRLPAEVWFEIAELLTREYAIATARKAWLTRRSFDCCIDTSANVWARFVSIDGVHYVANLTNTPVPGRGYNQIFHADKPPPTDILYILEDHLGIRQIWFACAETPVSWVKYKNTS